VSCTPELNVSPKEGKKVAATEVQDIWKDNVVSGLRSSLRADIDTMSKEWRGEAPIVQAPDIVPKPPSANAKSTSEHEVDSLIPGPKMIVPDSEEEDPEIVIQGHTKPSGRKGRSG